MVKQKALKRYSQEVQEDIRQRVVALIRNGSMDIKQAVQTFGVGQSTIYAWLKQFRETGKRSLKLKKRGRKKGSKALSRQQEQWVRKQIEDHHPEQLKLPFALWTRAAVRELIKKQFGILRSPMQVGRYLKEWGFTPQKPVYKAYEQQDEKVKAWLDEEYPAIKQQAKEENGEIYWCDEMGMRSDHQAGTTYAPKGKTPVIKRTGKRFRLNMISAINNKGKKQFMLFKDSFNSEKFIEFLKLLLKSSPRKIFLIVDGHPAHKTKKVQEFIERHCLRLEIFFLPGYSPELNPQEYMNNDVKTNAVARHRTLNADQLQMKVKDYVDNRPAQIIKNYFKHPKVQYAA